MRQFADIGHGPRRFINEREARHLPIRGLFVIETVGLILIVPIEGEVFVAGHRAVGMSLTAEDQPVIL